MTNREVQNLSLPGVADQQGEQAGATRSRVAYRVLDALSDALIGGRSSRQSNLTGARQSQEASEQEGEEEILNVGDGLGLEHEQPAREPQYANNEDPRGADATPTPANGSQRGSEMEEIDMRRGEEPLEGNANPSGAPNWLADGETLPKVYTQVMGAVARPRGRNDMRYEATWRAPGPHGLQTLWAALFTAALPGEAG